MHQSPRPPPLSIPAQRVTWERGADMTKTSVDQSALSPHARGGHLHSRSGRRTCTCPRQPSFFCRCSTPSPSLTWGHSTPLLGRLSLFWTSFSYCTGACVNHLFLLKLSGGSLEKKTRALSMTAQCFGAALIIDSLELKHRPRTSETSPVAVCLLSVDLVH